jgi:RNA polymerase sigma-70 factor (ECF subfamily)
MLGSVAEAEDMVQEAYLRWHQANAAEVRSPKAWLTAVVTRLCIDHLRAARTRREHYVGPWLPEPLLTADPTAVPHGRDAEAEVELAEGLSMALLMVLERLGPAERAAFLLREVFDYDYGEIADMVGARRDACRQMVLRARQRVRDERPRFEPTREERETLLQRFVAASTSGDMDGLLALFADDITLWSDGGGRAKAALNPIHGADNVARFVLGVITKLPAGYTAQSADINGAPGLIGYVDGQPVSTMSLDVDEGRIRGLALMVNPEKLGHLPPQDTTGGPALPRADS